jgi:hypothetical protein
MEVRWYREKPTAERVKEPTKENCHNPTVMSFISIKTSVNRRVSTAGSPVW